MKYLLIIHNDPALLESLSPAELDAMVGAHEPSQAALRETGELVGFAALTDLSRARVVRRPAGGAPVVTDGPYLEAKEHLAGFYVVDCETQERAAELAATMPGGRVRRGRGAGGDGGSRAADVAPLPGGAGGPGGGLTVRRRRR